MFLLRPRLVDFKIIGFYTGRLVLGIGYAMLIPLVISLFSREWAPAIDFVIGAAISLIIGYMLLIICRTEREIGWVHGVLVVPIAWIAAMVLGAIPLYLSGHFLSVIDAAFDTMSGLTTTGLSILQDLDHLSYGHNFWRHFSIFIGGQGIVIATITLMAGGASGGIGGMYAGEAREDKLMPNLIQTARFMWMISLIYLGVGTIILSLVSWWIGISPVKALFHGATILMAGFHTGGFSPQSQSILYYHSGVFELATLPFMVAGGINFALHYAVFTGNRREILRNVETVILVISSILVFSFLVIALSQAGAYESIPTIFRKVFYHAISAVTTTGFMTVYGPQFPLLWGPLAMVVVMLAMSVGSSSGSTSGGIKSLRIVIIWKAFMLEIRRMVLPPSAVVVEKYHHLKNNVIGEKQLLTAFLIGFAYIITYAVGGIIGVYFNYPFAQAFFESISAAGNVGLTSGVTSASMPDTLKVVYIVQMWLGRLEFMSILALIGFAISAVKGK